MARLVGLIVPRVAVMTVSSVLIDAQNTTDREASYLRGQVRTVRVEFAEIDSRTND